MNNADGNSNEKFALTRLYNKVRFTSASAENKYSMPKTDLMGGKVQRIRSRQQNSWKVRIRAIISRSFYFIIYNL